MVISRHRKSFVKMLSNMYLHRRPVTLPMKKYGSKTTTTGKAKSKSRSIRALRKRAYSRTVRKRKSIFTHQGGEMGTKALTTYGKIPRLSTMLSSIMNPLYLRISGLSQFDTSVGFYPLSQRADGTNIGLPVHVWDVSSIFNNVNDTFTNVQAGIYLGRVGNAADANTINFNLQSNTAAGATVTTAQWGAENSVTGETSSYLPQPMRKAYHEWSNIKLNLYGVRARTTKFMVELIQVKNRSADFFTSPDTSRDKKKLYDYLSKPLMYNNLNAGDPLTARFIKVVKSYKVTVSPIHTTDYGGEAAATPHIHNLNWFVKHNRLRHYDWSPGADPGSAFSALWDTENDQVQTQCKPEQRLYLVIRALSPVPTAVAAGAIPTATAGAVNEPSYDLIIRNKWLLNTP